MIQRYFDALKQAVDSFAAAPFVLDVRMSFELRPGNQGYVVGALLFQDQSALHFREYLDSDGGHVSKLMYTYHYQDADRQMFFRYDNARHQPALPMQEHKHVGEAITASHAPALAEVLTEIVMTRGWVEHRG